MRTETEYSKRPDGKLNVWQRVLGKFGWTHWQLVNVIQSQGGK